MSDDQETTNQSVNEIITILKKGKKLHDHFAEQFKNKYLIGGKLIHHWKEHFKISIPPDLNPHTCIEIDTKIMELHQEATFLKAEADARLTACKNASSEKYRTQFAALVAEYNQAGKKMPASATLTALAENNISDIKNALTHVEIEVAFWKEILNDIYSARKMIQNITINLISEAKALHNETYFNTLNKYERE
jgi:hypothetical protein